MLNQNTQNVKAVSISALTWDTFQRLGLVMSGDRFASLAYPAEEAEGLAHLAYCANIGAESKSAAWSRFVDLCATSNYTQIPAEVKAALSSKSFRDIVTDEAYTIAQMVEAYEADYLPTIEEGDEPLRFRAWLREIVENGDFEEVSNEAEESGENHTTTKGESSMAYTISSNPQFNSLEIVFSGKPAQEVRDALKALRFRWHSVRKCWYGYATEEQARAAIEGKTATATQPKAKKAEAANKYGVQVGDIFCASWGYEQTNNDFFQVVEVVGTCSVRVREVYPQIVKSSAVSSMSEDRVYNITRDILPAADRSVFIDNQERGDLKKLKSYAADGVSDPCFKLSSFADAHLVPLGEKKVYESWYY